VVTLTQCDFVTSSELIGFSYIKFILSDDDKEHCEKEGYASVLRDCGVGGLRFVNQVKCLHLQYGHYLASGGDNVVGEWTRAELVRRGESI
jgi:hypothetical protein